MTLHVRPILFGPAVCFPVLGLVLAGCTGMAHEDARQPAPVITPHFSAKPNPLLASRNHPCQTDLQVVSPQRAWFTVLGAPVGATFVVRPLSHVAGQPAPAPVLLRARSPKLEYRYTFHELGSPAGVQISVRSPHRPPETYDLAQPAHTVASGHRCWPAPGTVAAG